MTQRNTLLTKWGRLTAQEWLRRRQSEDMDKWLGPEQLHYVLTRIPFRDANGYEIVDFEFRRLLQDDPDQAHAQLHREFQADRIFQAQRQIQLAAEREAQKAAVSDFVQQKTATSRKRQRKPRPSHHGNQQLPANQLPFV